MGNLDIQLWEAGTQRLHQGLSETILVNTLTDVREFKKWLLCHISLVYIHQCKCNGNNGLNEGCCNVVRILFVPANRFPFHLSM